MLKSKKVTISAKAEPRNRKHTISTNAHKASHMTIHPHKKGGSKKRRASKKTILK
jgi:hypothetical protein